MKISRSIMGICCIVLLSACGSGGGGGDPAPVAPPQSFPLRGAFSALFANGETKPFTVSGTCNGTATFAQAATVGGANFNKVPGQLSATRTVALTLPNCDVLPTINGIVSSTVYYDTNYAPLGYDSSPNTGYGVFLAPAAMPESGKVGDANDLGTLTNYASSAKAAELSQTRNGYLVEADTGSCAIVTVIGRDFNASSAVVPQTTEQDRYRVCLTGAATLISIDIQTATGIHLIFK